MAILFQVQAGYPECVQLAKRINDVIQDTDGVVTRAEGDSEGVCGFMVKGKEQEASIDIGVGTLMLAGWRGAYQVFHI